MTRLFVVLPLSIWPALVPAANIPSPPAASGYNLVFHDDFDHLDLSPDGGGSHTWYEGVWFNRKHAPLSNISASNSALTLAWQRGQESPDTSLTTLSKGLK